MGKYYNFPIGTKVSYRNAFSLDCSERFPVIPGTFLRSKTIVPIEENGVGFIVGIKRVIVNDYHYYSGKSGEEYEAAFAAGEMRECFLLTKEIKPFKLFLVQRNDVICPI